jgi:hypothetical protein
MMENFDDRKIVLGLFNDDAGVKQAITQLHHHGFGQDKGDDIKVIDQSYLEIESSNAPNRKVKRQEATADSERANIVFDPVTGFHLNPDAVAKGAAKALDHLGVADEEADFYGKRIARGETLVVVETSEDRAPEVSRVIKQVTQI